MHQNHDINSYFVIIQALGQKKSMKQWDCEQRSSLHTLGICSCIHKDCSTWKKGEKREFATHVMHPQTDSQMGKDSHMDGEVQWVCCPKPATTMHSKCSTRSGDSTTPMCVLPEWTMDCINTNSHTQHSTHMSVSHDTDSNNAGSTNRVFILMNLLCHSPLKLHMDHNSCFAFCRVSGILNGWGPMSQ